MYRFGIVVILAYYFDLRVVDDEAAGAFLHLAVGDDLLAGCDDLGHERHVEPTAGDFSRSEDPAIPVHDDGFVETGFAEAFCAGVDHATGEANWFRGWLAGEAVELPPVFVAFREMIEQIRNGGDAGGLKCLDLLVRQGGQGGDVVLA